MSQTMVYDILDQIKQLECGDRNLLDDLLAQQEEVEWRNEAKTERHRAQTEGIDQRSIDRAVAAVRYGE